MIGLAVGFAVSISLLNPWFLAFVDREEWRLADIIHLGSGNLAAPPDDVVILGVDDASLSLDSLFPEDLEGSEALAAMSQGWPWPRSVWGILAGRLIDAGAAVVVLDFTFAMPSSPEADEAFTETLRKYPGKIVLGVDHQERDGSGWGGQQQIIAVTPSLLPPELRTEVPTGLLNFWPDADEVVRTQRPLWSRGLSAGEDAMPSLALATLRATGAAAPDIEKDRDYVFRFGHPQSFEPVSLHEIFVEPLWVGNFGSGEFFRDKVVFVGVTARHFQDFQRTPVGTLIGVQLHAQAFRALRDGDWLWEISPPTRIALVVVAALLAAGLAASFQRPLVILALLIAGMVLAIVSQWLAYSTASLVLPMLLPAASWFASGLFCLGYDFMLESRRRKELQRYFSSDMADELARNPAPYLRSLGGVDREITLLFSDLRGFTSLAERMNAADLVKHLNTYLEKMVQTVFDERGSIDKFIGDAIMAVWGRVRDDRSIAALDADAHRAVSAALRMREALEDLNRQWAEEGLPALKIGIGVHQGSAVVGNIGSAARMEFTAIGDTVNTAARLESLSKQYGVDLLVSQSVEQRIRKEFHFRPVDLVRVKGKSEAMAIFTVVAASDAPVPGGLEEFKLAVEAYRRAGFVEALEGFEDASRLGFDDALTHLQIQRCREMIESPPANGWDGVFTATEK